MRFQQRPKYRSTSDSSLARPRKAYKRRWRRFSSPEGGRWSRTHPTLPFGSLINEYGGSYVLAIAAYNAGSYRVNQWIGDWGDPRRPSADVVDWIELIPFNETRNYVERVLENLQVYRMRLASGPTPITIEQDLHRGSGAMATPAASDPEARTQPTSQ